MNVGAYRHALSLSVPTDTADSEGGYTQTWAALSPATALASIEPTTARERNAANTVIAQATHIIHLRYHPDVTTRCRVQWTDRGGRTHTANVSVVEDLEGAGVEMRLFVTEIAP